MKDIFAPVFLSIEEMIAHAQSDSAKVELIDMLIKSLNQAKEKLQNSAATKTFGYSIDGRHLRVGRI